MDTYQVTLTAPSQEVDKVYWFDYGNAARESGLSPFSFLMKGLGCDEQRDCHRQVTRKQTGLEFIHLSCAKLVAEVLGENALETRWRRVISIVGSGVDDELATRSLLRFMGNPMSFYAAFLRQQGKTPSASVTAKTLLLPPASRPGSPVLTVTVQRNVP